MPYPSAHKRPPLETYSQHLLEAINGDETALAFSILRIVTRFREGKGSSYRHRALVDGILGTIHQEYRRKHLDPYLDRKQFENGDIT